MDIIATSIRKFKDACVAFASRPLIWLGLLGAYVAVFPLFYCVVNFVVAQTPEQALAAAQLPIPTGCEAGVMNHGKYICWYTMHHHPFAFGSLVAFSALDLFLILALRRKAAAPNNSFKPNPLRSFKTPPGSSGGSA